MITGHIRRVLVLVGLGLTLHAHGAQTIQYGDAAQGPVNTGFVIDLINNDPGTIYQSATLDLDGLLGNVADWISQNSTDPSFAGKTHTQIYSQIYFTPGGEVSTGWSTAVNGTTLEITHVNGIPGLEYTTWQSTAYNSGSQDMMRLYVSFPNAALNGHNITMTSTPAANAFVAKTTAGPYSPAPAYAYAVLIPTNPPFAITNLTIGTAAVTLAWASPLNRFIVARSSALATGGFSCIGSVLTTNAATVNLTNLPCGFYRIRQVGVVGPAQIPDPHLWNAVTNAVPIWYEPRSQVYDIDLEGITTLNASRQSVSNATGLARLTRLTNLDISGNALTSLDISGCTNLVQVDCSTNGISDLSSFVSNAMAGGLGSNDLVTLYGNPLTMYAKTNQIPYLQMKGATVYFTP